MSIFTRQLNSYLKLKLSNGTELKTSVDIKIFKDGEWVSPIGNTSCSCSNCGCGDKLFFNDIKITSIKWVDESIELISIEVEPDHNYFVGNLLVHNTGPQGSKGPKGAQGAQGHQVQQVTRLLKVQKVHHKVLKVLKDLKVPQGPSPKVPQVNAQGSLTGVKVHKGASPKGSQGAQGPPGSSPQGAQGAQGASGSSPTGPQGAQGASGSSLKGPQGAQGAQGSSPQGAQGPSGSSPKGSQGAQGASVVQVHKVLKDLKVHKDQRVVQVLKVQVYKVHKDRRFSKVLKVQVQQGAQGPKLVLTRSTRCTRSSRTKR